MPKEGGGGGTPDFKWQGCSNEGKAKKQNPQSRLGFKQNPQKIPAPKVLVSNTQKIPT